MLFLALLQGQVRVWASGAQQQNQTTPEDPPAVHRSSRQDVHKAQIPQIKERTCSRRLGVATDNEVCMSILLRAAKVSGELLLRELAETDHNFLVRRIHVMTHEPDVLTINRALDVFLEPRPWWVIRKEVFVGLEYFNTSSIGGAAATTSSANDSASAGGGKRALSALHAHEHASAHAWSHVFLQRYDIKLEPHLYQISAVQFPPLQECATSRLKLSHTVNSGWGSASAFYGIFVTERPWSVFLPYESNTNTVAERVMYASPDLCPNTVNKWTCAFLPTTNCTVPDQVTTCSGSACNWDGDLLYTSASREGKQLSDEDKSALADEKDKQAAHTPYHKAIDAWYGPLRQAGFQAEPFLTSKDQVTDSHRPDKFLVTKVFGQIWRPNAVYRTLISRRIEAMWREMFERHGLPPLVVAGPGVGVGVGAAGGATFENGQEQPKCTAIHVRRGDRSINMEGKAMRDWCQQWLPFTNWDNCTSHSTGQRMACQTLSDYGCFSNNPFGALTLNDYLNASWGLLKTRNVFVLTDAAAWLDKERTTVDKAWSIYSIASNGGKDRSNDTPRATMNGVEYHASMRMAQNCQAFVGHWGSGVSHMIYNAMCWRQGNTVLAHCPPAKDMS